MPEWMLAIGPMVVTVILVTVLIVMSSDIHREPKDKPSAYAWWRVTDSIVRVYEVETGLLVGAIEDEHLHDEVEDESEYYMSRAQAIAAAKKRWELEGEME
jgi:hypothetical protein